MTSFILLCAAITGGVFGRGKGSKLIDLPHPLDQLLFCLIFGVVMQLSGLPLLHQVVAMALAVAACVSGHGQYFLGLMVKACGPEFFDIMLRPFFGKDPRTDEKYEHLRGKPQDEYTGEESAAVATDMLHYGMEKLYWRNVAGMALTGVLVSLAPGIALFINGHYLSGVILGLSGLIKAPAYMISQRIGKGTEGGEWGHGGAQWLIGALVIVFIIGVCHG